MKTKIWQLTAGAGPVECHWVVAQVLKVLLEDLKNNGIDYEILHKEKGALERTLKSVIIQIKGTGLSELSSKWCGTILWVGTSQYRKFHKRKNWYIACKEWGVLKEKTLRDEDLKYQAIRASGPGGQHVNKVSSAIRLKHLPTGLQVVASERRSQKMNKKLAKERLSEKLTNFEMDKLRKEVKEYWKNHQEIERGNPVRTFKGKDFKASFGKNKERKKPYKSQRQKLKNELEKIRLET
ncbi:MAG: peptide chain release factor H [Flavobacteriales bacterium]|jgi:peptide chain release factor|nr:peptide chain release factor H [Flavobacteriales bacterium]